MALSLIVRHIISPINTPRSFNGDSTNHHSVSNTMASVTSLLTQKF